MTVYPPVSVFLGDCGECQELAEGSLASPAAVTVAVVSRIEGDQVQRLPFEVIGATQPNDFADQVVGIAAEDLQIPVRDVRHGMVPELAVGADPVRLGAGSMVGEADRVRRDREGAPVTR
jgi:hypothetical protein